LGDVSSGDLLPFDKNILAGKKQVADIWCYFNPPSIDEDCIQKSMHVHGIGNFQIQVSYDTTIYRNTKWNIYILVKINNKKMTNLLM